MLVMSFSIFCVPEKNLFYCLEAKKRKVTVCFSGCSPGVSIKKNVKNVLFFFSRIMPKNNDHLCLRVTSAFWGLPASKRSIGLRTSSFSSSSGPWSAVNLCWKPTKDLKKKKGLGIRCGSFGPCWKMHHLPQTTVGGCVCPEMSRKQKLLQRKGK